MEIVESIKSCAEQLTIHHDMLKSSLEYQIIYKINYKTIRRHLFFFLKREIRTLQHINSKKTGNWEGNLYHSKNGHPTHDYNANLNLLVIYN